MTRALVALAVGLAVVSATVGHAAAQDAPVNTVTPPPSDFVASASGLSRLELVPAADPNGLTDLVLLAEGTNQLACHLPCVLEVPPGMVHLVGTGLDQRFDLQLPIARFALRAGEPVPWAASIGGRPAGLALGGVGVWAMVTSPKTDEVVGGAVLLTLGVAVVALVTVALVLYAIDEAGAVELVPLEEALRDGTIARF